MWCSWLSWHQNIFALNLFFPHRSNNTCIFFYSDQKLFGLHLRSEQTGHHAVGGKPRFAGGDRKDVPKRERLRAGWKVRTHLRNAHNLPHLPLHCHSHNRLRSAVRHHCYTQVRLSKHYQQLSLAHFSCSFVFSLLRSRSVDEEDRPFALGMQFVLLRTLGKTGWIWQNLIS